MVVALILAEGLEEGEAVIPWDLLDRAGIRVEALSIGSTLEVKGSHKIILKAESFIKDVKAKDYDALILPGGMPGSAHLAENRYVEEFIKHFINEDKIIATLCAAPVKVLGSKGFLKGKNYTCYPSLAQEDCGGIYIKEDVVIDNKLITASGLGTAYKLAGSLITLLKGKEEAEKVLKQTLFLS